MLKTIGIQLNIMLRYKCNKHLLISFSGTSFFRPDMSWAINCPNGSKSTLFSSTLYFSRARNSLMLTTLGLGNALPFVCIRIA